MGAARAEAPIRLDQRQPFKQTVARYFEAGWLPMPLPPKRKEEPPTGFTGWNPRHKVTLAQIRKWQSKVADGSNICARAREDYIGIDVDLYKGDAQEQWDAITEEMGELPDTWTSSARDDKSGIRHYRLPEGYRGLAWPGTVGDAIQFIHTGHRYAVLPPSRHPQAQEDGSLRFYQWYGPGEEVDGDGIDDGSFPAYDELTELPVEWILYFTQGKFAKHLPEKDLGTPTKAKKIVSAWIAERAGEPCAKMVRAYDEVLEQFDANAAHDTMSAGFYRLASLSCEGHAGLSAISSRLREDFLTEVKREGRGHTARGAAEAEEEFLRARDGAVKKIMLRDDTGEFEGFVCECAELDAEGKPKPLFNVTNFDLVEALSLCYKALGATEVTEWNGAYNRGGQIMLRTRHGLVEADVNSLRSAVARATEWVRPGGDGPPQKAIPPRDLLSTLLVDPELNTLPGLRYITRSPFWALVDAKPVLVHENGYHAGSQVIVEMDPELADAVRNVDGGDFAFGTRKLHHMLHKFPFKSEADRANVYAALLLPYVRELIVGPTPLHLVHAPSPGSGKTLLANSVSKVVCGMEMTDRFSVTLPAGRNADEEIRKLTTTGLKKSPRVFIWDNVVGEVRSKEIAQALTEPVYNARHLGTDDGLLLPNACLWMATGNQFKAIEDIRRRIVPIELKAFASRKAPFDMDEFLEKNRKYIVWALLSMVQVWVDEGMPLARNVTLPSYERYAEVIGGILASNGVDGFLANLAEFNEQTTGDSGEYPELIEEWASPHSTLDLGEWYRVGDILNALTSVSEWVDTSKPGAIRSLGIILTGMKDRPIGENGEFLLQFKRPGNVAHYCLTAKTKAKVVRRGGARRKVR